MKAIFGVAFLAALGCKGKATDTGPSDVPLGPEMSYSLPTEALRDGDSLPLSVTASDPDGVSTVQVQYRTTGSPYFESLDLGDAGDGTWTGAIDNVAAPGIEFYFQAADSSSAHAVSYLPSSWSTEPYALEVGLATTTLPFAEDFEPEGTVDTLYEMQWFAPSEGPIGYGWEVQLGDCAGGEACAFHSRGFHDSGELVDWMVTPALDFSSVSDGVGVSWYERGVSTDEAGTHSLWLSLGSRDPLDGDFFEIEADLPLPPEDGWARSGVVDLSAYVGEPVVYVAWRYVGEAADDWYVDDVMVGDLSVDLSASVAWDPDPVAPGETTTVTVTFGNGTATAGADLVGVLSLPDGGGSLAEDTVEIGAIEGFGTATADWSLTIDAETDANRYLPLALSVTDGVDTWEFELEMVVGVLSTGEIALTLDEAATVNLTVGVGDPDAPTVSLVAYAGALDAGTHTISVDLTDQGDLLPPAAGDLRWWARAQASAGGRVGDFSIHYGGTPFAATVLPSFVADTAVTVYVPEPPAPQITSFSPTEVEPGQTGMELSFTAWNAGEDTAGAVSATLVGADPDVTIVDPGPVELTAGVWAAGTSESASGLVFDVSAGHTDSRPVRLEIELDDGLESWVVDVDVDVPWPVIRVLAIEVDDDDNEDGILDAGETAQLEIEIGNSGGLDTFGSLSGTLSVASGSVAELSIEDPDLSLPSLTQGGTRTIRTDVEVSAGNDGDTVDLLISLDDGTTTYEVESEIVLGEPTWNLLSLGDDPTGDALDESDFDLLNGRYRVVDGEVQLVLSSDTAYDSGQLFIEAWGSAGGASYTYYRWVLQSGTATMQGYTQSDGFTTIGTLGVDFLSSTEVMLTWDAADMGLATNAFNIGFAAGWCGPPSYYCDHFPDGWGYPYDAFSAGDWYAIRW